MNAHNQEQVEEMFLSLPRFKLLGMCIILYQNLYGKKDDFLHMLSSPQLILWLINHYEWDFINQNWKIINE